MDTKDAVVTIEHKYTPHHLYLAIGFAIVVILAAGVGFTLYELGQIERNVNKSAASSADTLAMVNQALKGTHKNGDDGLLVLSRILLQNSTGAMNALKQTMQDVNRIAKDEQPKTVELTDSSLALVKTAGGTVAKLGDAVDTLNGVIGEVRTATLPKLNTGVDSLNGLVSDLRPAAQASTQLMTEATGAVTELKATVVTANALLADPELPVIVHNFSLMSGNLNGAALHANNALGFVELDLTPLKLPFWKSILSTALSQAIGIPLKYLPQAVTVVSTVAPTPKK
jgi:hypothetical protein